MCVSVKEMNKMHKRTLRRVLTGSIRKPHKTLEFLVGNGVSVSGIGVSIGIGIGIGICYLVFGISVGGLVLWVQCYSHGQHFMSVCGCYGV